MHAPAEGNAAPFMEDLSDPLEGKDETCSHAQMLIFAIVRAFVTKQGYKADWDLFHACVVVSAEAEALSASGTRICWRLWINRTLDSFRWTFDV